MLKLNGGKAPLVFNAPLLANNLRLTGTGGDAGYRQRTGLLSSYTSEPLGQKPDYFHSITFITAVFLQITVIMSVIDQRGGGGWFPFETKMKTESNIVSALF